MVVYQVIYFYFPSLALFFLDFLHVFVYFTIMKRRDLEKKLKKMSWWLTRHGGKHDVWTDGEREVAIPRHNEINEYTAKAILCEAKGDDK